MKKYFLFSLSALLALALSSCSSTDFMKRKYLPGRFYDKPVTMKGETKNNSGITILAFSSDSTNGNINTLAAPEVDHANNITPVELKKTPRTFKAGLLRVLPFKKILSKNPVTKTPLFKSSDKRKGLAWLSLIFGILAFYPYAIGTLTAALLAIIFGMIQIHRVHNDSSEFGGKGIALLGMLLGLIAVAVVFLFLLAAVA